MDADQLLLVVQVHLKRLNYHLQQQRELLQRVEHLVMRETQLIQVLEDLLGNLLQLVQEGDIRITLNLVGRKIL